LALHPKDERTLYFLAFLLHGKGLNSEAETALRDLLQSDLRDPDVKASASHLLGVVLDARGQYPDAIRWLGQAKTQMCQLTDPTALQLSYDRMDQARRELLADLTPETLRRWREKAGGAPGSHRMAFLGGPPMSGTALIEQVLGNHSEILLVDESEAFAQELLTALHPPAPARGLTLKALNALPPTARSQMIDRYFKSLLRETDKQPGGKLLVDKNPSLTASLHIWLRLFPQLKVIIALRDPRDVVISCYFQNLPLTAANSNFLSLERTAKYYADCMDVWLRLRELGGFDWIETRYENAVANLEAEGQRVTGFLGLPWQRAQASLDESACRKFIFAPTYNEATQPVAGRWKNYADALAPLHESLEKYCRALGYE
jgi:hypothetical protein